LRCEVCTAAGLACASFGGSRRCVSIPPECADNPTCGCIGVCPGGAPCVDPNSTEIDCVCTTC
jgi:hypothetical protein